MAFDGMEMDKNFSSGIDFPLPGLGTEGRGVRLISNTFPHLPPALQTLHWLSPQSGENTSLYCLETLESPPRELVLIPYSKYWTLRAVKIAVSRFAWSYKPETGNMAGVEFMFVQEAGDGRKRHRYNSEIRGHVMDRVISRKRYQSGEVAGEVDQPPRHKGRRSSDTHGDRLQYE